jgi:hypothetical protein
MTVSATTTTPSEGVAITITLTLRRADNNAAISGRVLNLYNGAGTLVAQYPSNSAGQIAWSVTYHSAPYTDGFTGRFYADSLFGGTNSSTLYIYVTATTWCWLTAGAYSPTQGDTVTFAAGLQKTDGGVGVPGQTLRIYQFNPSGSTLVASGTTNGAGVIAWSHTFPDTGTFYYYSAFAAENQYQACKSTPDVTINVQPSVIPPPPPTQHTTSLSLTASDAAPQLFGNVTFTAILTSSGAGVNNETINFYYYDPQQVQHTMDTTATSVNGTAVFTTQFTDPLLMQWYASFGGDLTDPDNTYSASTSSMVLVNAGGPVITINPSTTVTITANVATLIINYRGITSTVECEANVAVVAADIIIAGVTATEILTANNAITGGGASGYPSNMRITAGVPRIVYDVVVTDWWSAAVVTITENVPFAGTITDIILVGVEADVIITENVPVARGVPSIVATIMEIFVEGEYETSKTCNGAYSAGVASDGDYIVAKASSNADYSPDGD